MRTDTLSSECKFYDAINFPHGFGRSGLFTRRETELLTQCGYMIKQLVNGTTLPANPEQESMLAVALGLTEPLSELEKAWAKYQRFLTTKVIKINLVGV